MPVSATKAIEQAVPTDLRVVGTVEASAIVQIKSQIAGELTSVNFTEGQNVNEGRTAFPHRFAALRRRAAAGRSGRRARQGADRAGRSHAGARQRAGEIRRQRRRPAIRTEQRRPHVEIAIRSIAHQCRCRQGFGASHAGHHRERARRACARIKPRSKRAKLNLSYCEIHAPISGRTGNLLVHAGNLVKVNDVALVVIHQVSPIFVDFSVPEQHLGAIRRLNASQKLAVHVSSQDDPGRTAAGVLSVIDNTVDSTTGTIHLKATFDNRDGMLWPGQFVTAVLTLDTIQQRHRDSRRSPCRRASRGRSCSP